MNRKVNNKRKMIIAAVIAVAAIAFIIIFTFINQENNKKEQSSNENMLNSPQKISNTNISLSTSTTEQEINEDADSENDNDNSGDDNFNNDNITDSDNDSIENYNNENQSVYKNISQPSSHAQSKNNFLNTLNQQENQQFAINIINTLRNYDAGTFRNIGFSQQIASYIDASRLKKNDDNLLYTATQNSYIRMMSSSDKVSNKIVSVNHVDEYIDTINHEYVPVVSIELEEEGNEDYPYPNSDHWCPIDRTKNLYLIYLSPSGNKCFNVKKIKSQSQVLQEDIYGTKKYNTNIKEQLPNS